MKTTDLIPRIAEKIQVADCWEWTAGKSVSGYGTVWHDGRTRRAHRVVWEALVGPVPEGMEFDHLCRNRACVNPDHLEVVDRSTNVRRDVRHCSEHNDRLKDGRCRPCRNEWKRNARKPAP